MTKYWENCQDKDHGLGSVGNKESTMEITTQGFHELGHRHKEETVLVSTIK